MSGDTLRVLLIEAGTLFREYERDLCGKVRAWKGGTCPSFDAIVAEGKRVTDIAIRIEVALAAPPTALDDIALERARQMGLGWTPDHDDEHGDDRALPRAAACYALAGTGGGNGPFWITHLQVPQQVWPYRWEWKPKDRRTNLIRAAALLVAEIERLDRAAGEEIVYDRDGPR